MFKQDATRCEMDGERFSAEKNDEPAQPVKPKLIISKNTTFRLFFMINILSELVLFYYQA
jgi:hypothetical protein